MVLKDYNTETGHVETLYAAHGNTPEIRTMMERIRDLQVREHERAHTYTHHVLYISEQ